MQLILYDSSGCERRLMAACSPYFHGSHLIGCLLAIGSTEAITLNDALTDLPRASVLVSADAPHPTHTANNRFLGRLAIPRSAVLGRPLSPFLGDLGIFDSYVT